MDYKSFENMDAVDVSKMIDRDFERLKAQIARLGLKTTPSTKVIKTDKKLVIVENFTMDGLSWMAYLSATRNKFQNQILQQLINGRHLKHVKLD